MLKSEELEEVINDIIRKVTLANCIGKLEFLLHQWYLDNLLSDDSVYETNKNGKIVVIVQSKVKKNVLIEITKSLNFV
ncbi:hypothetical protein [Thomasclavelia cocleata]|uniref:hypothetical protein n=1 Tax=Thomasclavelia cocleata TaxID=69824 RepID=UPI00243117EC|nr:hypothetical protein [Thomasclavelia cocleata]